MKKLRYIIVALLITACGKELDVNPTVQLDSKDAKKKIDLLLIGAYSLIGSGGVAQTDEGGLYSNDLILNADLLASENYMGWRGTFNTYNEISNKVMSSTNTTIIRMWRKAYSAINLTNTILELLPNSDVADKDLVKGQALFIRGIVQFELLRFWGEPSTGLGVPIIKQSTQLYEEIKFPARASITETYAAILDDLTTAKSLLPEDNDDLADKYTVAAFLARVYLTQGEYDKARAEAIEVIDSKKYELVGSVENAFNTDGSSETVFAILQTTQNNSGVTNDGLTTFFACDPLTPGATGRGDVQIDSLFRAKYEETDKRSTKLIYDGTCFKGSVTSGKWKNPYTSIPVIRLSEMFLIRAEANQRLGEAKGGKVIDDVNLIRAKAGASPLGAVTLDDILLERELEFAFEGQRIHDFKRLGTVITLLDEKGKVVYDDKNIEVKIDYSGPEFIMPIPQQDINANTNLQQNSYYK